jgi:hypothetical protein
MSECINRFDFKRSDIDAMVSHLTVVNCPGVFIVNGIETCVGQFYDEVSKFVAGGPPVKYPWLNRELRNLAKRPISL